MINNIDEINIGVTDIRRIAELLKSNYNLEINNYALTSMKRRLKKCISINELGNFENLMKKLESPEFFTKFMNDTSIEVTEMFRDPAFWRELKTQIIPDLLKKFNTINVWIPDFSSADEIYSLAILALEDGYHSKINIHATAVHQSLIRPSEIGLYQMKKLEVSEANYKRFNDKGDYNQYYTLEKFGFKMNSNLLSEVKFSTFDIVKDEMPCNYHLIIARNQLLYFNSNMHDNCVTLFSKALVKDGYLAIGTQETIEFCRDSKKFTLINPMEKIYKKNFI